MKDKFVIIETTFSNSAKGKKLAKKLAQILLKEKLAACVQFCAIESMYVWQKKISNDQEILLSIKSKKSLFKKIKNAIEKHHIYEIPQIISVEINQGSAAYLKWIDSNTKNPK